MTEMERTELLVIGAGPYGLATARQGIRTLVLGHAMSFWRENMPATMMLLRSGPDWHLDVAQEHTLMAFLTERGLDPAEIDPIPIALFLEYADWFREMAGVETEPDLVENLAKPNGDFEAALKSGRRILAESVVAAPGISRFGMVPEWVERSLSPGSWSHTCDLVDFEELRGKRVLILGGRQSAFEWAALLAEEGAAEVHVVHRHASPEFAPADWSFVDPLMDLTVEVPGWFRNLPEEERKSVAGRFWAEGRLKLEPWLTPRLTIPPVVRHPPASVEDCREENGEIPVRLSTGKELTVDHLVLATGYKPDMTKFPYLSGVVDRMDLVDGFPVLDDNFQTSLPGLFVTGFPATRDFGPFFGFVRGCVPAAILTVEGLMKAKPVR